MCGSAISNVVETILSPITPKPPKVQQPPAPPPPPATPPQPPPPATPPQPEASPTQAPIIGGQRNLDPGRAGAGRGSLVIPINLGGIAGGTGLNIPR